MSCLDFLGTPCGSFGECITIEPASETCVCHPGWHQTQEMALYFLSRDDVIAGLGLCNINTPLLMALYGIMLAVSALGLLMQLCQISKRSQLRRLVPLLAALALCSFASLYRLVRFDTALIGKDTFFTFLIANLAYLPAAATVIFSEKYLRVLTVKVPILHEETLKTFVLFKRYNKVSLVADVLVYQILWISMFTGMQHEQGQILFRATLGIMGLRGFSLMIVVHLTLSKFVNDMQRILDEYYTDSDDNESTLTGAGPMITRSVTNMTPIPLEAVGKTLPRPERKGSHFQPKAGSSDKNLKRQMKSKLIPQTKLYRLLYDLSTLTIFIGFGTAAAFPLVTYNTSYIMPIFHINWQIVNLVVLCGNARKLNKAVQTGYNSSSAILKSRTTHVISGDVNLRLEGSTHTLEMDVKQTL